MPPTHLFRPLPSPSPENDPAVSITSLFRSGGPGTVVLLERRGVYPIFSQIDLCHPGSSLATEGYPSFESGEQAVIETRGEKEATAVRLFQYPQTSLKRVHVRGCRGWGATLPSEEERERGKKEGRLGWIEGGGALVWMGGPEGHEQLVEGCRLEDPRGWTGVHLVDFAQRCKIIDNIVGPCGQQAPGPWADGLSIAGSDSLIAGNTVIDATDGAIVLFCAPGSMVTNNTIIARERDVLGAINMVDDFPFDRNFENTRVIGNRIKGEGAFIRLGIGMGPTCWNGWGEHHTLNYGGQVLHNYFGPGQFGYAMSLSGVKNFTVQGNTLLPHTRFGGSTHRFYAGIPSAPPTAFVRQWADRGRVLESEVQPEFMEGEVQWLIGVEPEVGERLEYEAGQVTLDVRGMSRAGEGGIAMKGMRWEVSRKGEVLLRKVEGEVDKWGYGEYGRGRVVWSSGGKKHGGGSRLAGEVQEPQLDFRLDGSLVLRSHGGKGDVLWSPSSYLTPFLNNLPTPPPPSYPSAPTKPDQWLSRPKLVLQTSQPYLQLRDWKGNTLFSTEYEYRAGTDWTIHGGQWIAVAPSAVRGSALSEQEGEEYGVPTPPQPPSPGQAGPPPVPQRPDNHQHHHSGNEQEHGFKGHFGRFVKDLSSTLQQHGVDIGSSFPNFTHPQPTSPAGAGGPPPIPPRPDFSSSAPPSNPSDGTSDASRKPLIPTFLYLSPTTCQLILHSSPSGPTSPTPEHTHWSAPPQPVDGAKDPWVSFQGDGNVVMYTSQGVAWASGTNGENGARVLRLKGHGEEGGPAVEMVNERGEKIWSSRG
ncbi:hypothetical protein JCM8547_003306 [Rhodosporidiobolus lusitaniae]